MTREQNHDRGHAAEARIMKKLEAVADVVHNEKPKGIGSRYPDITMKLNGSTYAIECKSVLSFHAGGEVGSAKMSITEFHGMNKLEQAGMIPILIVEIRPKYGTSIKPCFLIDWTEVQEKFKEHGYPGQISLRYYWILETGQNLNLWLRQKSMEAIQV